MPVRSMALILDSARSLLCGIRASLGVGRLTRGLKDPWFWLLAGLACLGLPFQGRPVDMPLWFVAAPFVEELTWRALLQEELERAGLGKISGSLPGLTVGNVAASGLFALAHLAALPSLLSALTFFPSLAMGLVWTKHKSLPLCAFLHLAYNVAHAF